MNDVATVTSVDALGRHRSTSGWAVASLATASMVVTAAAIGAAASTTDTAANALLRAFLVAAPLAAGFYAAHTPQHRRVAPIFMAIGAVSFLTTLADTSDPVLYTVGRAAGWGLEILLVAAVLAIPAREPLTSGDRRLVWATAFLVVACFAPLLVLSGVLPVPSPWTSCQADCPVSPLALSPRQASPLTQLLPALGSLLMLAVMISVIVRLQQHVATATAVQRALLGPVLLTSMVRAGLVATAITWRVVAPSDDLVNLGSVLIAWATPMLSVAFLIGALRARLRAEFALRQLTSDVQHGPSFAELERALIRALGDPSMTCAIVTDEQSSSWSDVSGNPIAEPGFDANRRTTFVHDRDGELIAAISRDPSPADCPELVAAAGTIIGASIENARLAKQAATVERDLQQSRARLVSIADLERHRIERDLHDGAQQRLVALRIDLGLVGDLVHTDPDRCSARLQVLEHAVDDTLDELRALAQGVCPPLLTDRGVSEALQAVATRSPVPTRVEAHGIGRYPIEIETAVYFCVLEALQNIAKHAVDATQAAVHLEANRDDLSFRVTDDGRGQNVGRSEVGNGLLNMHDRVAAVGGELDVRFTDRLGTTVSGRVPLQTARLVPPAQDR